MSGRRDVLMILTARGRGPIDRQRFAHNFLARHTASRLLSDGLVHAFSRTRQRLKRAVLAPEALPRASRACTTR